MKALRIQEKGKLAVEEIPLPVLGPRDVLIQVRRAGICGTDVGVLHGFIPVKFPITPGHEFSGVISRLGSPEWGEFKAGDPVTASGGWGCGSCEHCQKGMGQFCKHRFSLGRTTDGCFAEFVRVDYKAIHRLPPHVSFDDAQNFLNIACVVGGFKKVPFPLGKSAVILGPGNIGLIILQLLKMAGAWPLLMVGTRDFRLEIAKRLGADHIVNTKRKDPGQAIRAWFGEGADLVVEATGNASSFQTCCQVVKPKGAILSFGIFSEKIKEFDLSFLYYKEPVIYGSKGGSQGYPEALQLLQMKRLQIAPLISHRFPLEASIEAFRTYEDKDAESSRIVIEPSV